MEPELLVTIDGKQYARDYNDGAGWPHPECEREAECAFREAYLAAARKASEWDFPFVEEVEAAWEERCEARRQAQVLVTSAQLFDDPSYDDYDPPGMHYVFQRMFPLSVVGFFDCKPLALNEFCGVRGVFV